MLYCTPLPGCALLETSFLLLVTATTLGLLATVLAAPQPGDTAARDTPQCVGFGISVIWFASITLNLGPTFLSGTMAANINHRPREPSCPLVQVEIHFILFN